jgi:hypothetical protein
MSTAQIFVVEHFSTINSAGYPNFSCPYQTPIKVKHIVSKVRNNSSSVNITNMVKVLILNFGVMSKKFNADIGQTYFLVGL